MKGFNGNLRVLMNHVADGYFQAGVRNATKKKCKLIVTNGNHEVIYNLDNSKKLEQFPLQFGNGEYAIRLYEHVKNNAYKRTGRVILKNVQQNGGWRLVKNQYVNWTDPDISQTALEIQDVTNGDPVDGFLVYLSENFKYDKARAKRLKNQKNILPNIDKCFKEKKGICQDLAALLVAMCRSCDIPSELRIGYADGNYHAWAIIDNFLEDPTAEICNSENVYEYEDERWY